MKKIRLLPWFVWVVLFCSFWLAIVIKGNHWHQVANHWPIALAMAFGSYVAGSTPMGGGAVGFPILVLLFDYPATLGRNFSLCIQAIGMFSASLYLLASGRKVAWDMLKWAMLSSAISLPLTTVFLAPYVTDLFIKLLFAIVWCSFGIMTLVKINDMCALLGINRHAPSYDRYAGLTVGLIGGMVAAVTGVGIDMAIFAVLVLMWRADLKIAIPTSVIAMAFASQVGVLTNYTLGNLDTEVFYNWLAAAPVVCLGAPFGAFMVNLIPRKPTLIFVSMLCIGQFVWTCIVAKLTSLPLAAAIGGVLVCQLAFHFMFGMGKRMEATAGRARALQDAHLSMAGQVKAENPRPAPEFP